MKARPEAVWGLLAAGALIACGRQEVDLPTPGSPPGVVSPIPPTLPPAPPTLVVCTAEEPASLYWYAAGPAAAPILEAIYDGPIDSRRYAFQPVILEKLPSLADGDARVEEVLVGQGEVFFSPETFRPENLTLGATFLPSGCRDASCARAYQGGRVRMDRLVADFRLRADLRWSDGMPLAAADSVFSYELDADPATPSTKFRIDRTAVYEAVDDRTVRWTGIPGWMDSSYPEHFWAPLPRHAWSEIAPADLPGSEAAARRPLGWGSYRVEAWTPGREIVLRRNPEYFRAAEGLPEFELLIVRFLGADLDSALDQLRTGECDVLDESVTRALAPADLAEGAGKGDWSTASAPGALARLDFRLIGAGGNPATSDVRVRRAVGLCIDRDALAQEVLAGMGSATFGYLPADHPLAGDGPGSGSVDREGAASLLDEAGWLEDDGDPATPRTARGVEGVPDGTALRFPLTVSDDDLHRSLAEELQRHLAQCGIRMELVELPAEQLFAPWPDGPVLGGGFDAVLWAWQMDWEPSCEAFAGWQVPGEARPLGVNATGWSDPDFDQACAWMQLAFVEDPGYVEALQVTQDRLAADIPSIPLVWAPRAMAYRTDVCGLEADPTAAAGLWAVEAIRGECPPDGG
jgi:peptide/nickel transport system substrate-binding protein